MNTIPNEAQLREHLVQATGWVKEQLRRADIGSNFTLEITLRGPIQNAEGSKLEYSLDCTSNNGGRVYGNSLNSVTFELLRRMGWQNKNTGLAITFNGADAPSLSEDQ